MRVQPILQRSVSVGKEDREPVGLSVCIVVEVESVATIADVDGKGKVALATIESGGCTTLHDPFCTNAVRAGVVGGADDTARAAGGDVTCEVLRRQ